MSFAALGLTPALLRAIEQLAYTAPTAVQSAAIPAALSGRDVLASAQTGSGKTIAFALPLLQQIETEPRQDRRSVRALVLVPTRELATQVAEVVRGLASSLATQVKVVTAIGGVSINPQMMALRGGADVVIATPGRWLDLLEHRAASLTGLAVLVLDEADRLLEAEFADEVSRILEQLPSARQTLMFSATFPPPVVALAQQVLDQPLRIDVAAAPVAAITERAIAVDAPRRTQLLLELIARKTWPQVLVFVATRHASEHVATKLWRHGVAAAALHGELSQGARSRMLADFKSGTLQVLVATDLAARGIDIDRLPAVVNYDLPRAASDYLHRIGRTGRAGAAGTAISFVSASTEAHFRLIEKRQGRRVPREVLAGFEPSETEPPGTGAGGIKGKRKSKKDKLREAAERNH